MIAKDPIQPILKAVKEYLSNITYDGSKVPVTTTFDSANDTYIMLSAPDSDDGGSTDDSFIFDVTVRVEVMTEFITGEEQETPSNVIMGQITELLTDEEYVNAVLNGFDLIVVAPFSSEKDTQQENVSSVIIKRKDFNFKVEQL